ncbi:MAG TPA: HlyD family efflux transporter periplasmic adaptor subunit [Spirochaetia bacterium]|nr:HlyD family efflux transporter periplasmic adaptor subunit [Spirochaetia bacterium]
MWGFASKSGTTVVCTLLFVIIGSVFLLSGCDQARSSQSSRSGDPTNSAPAVAKSATNGANGAPASRDARIETRTRSVLVGGRLEPKTRVQHTVPVDGLVRTVQVTPGMHVAEGDSLFTVQRNDVGQTYLPAPVTARVAGIVSQVDVIANREVKPGDPGVTVIGSDGYLLEAAISDRDAYSVRIGQTVEARAPNGTIFSGTLAVRSPEPDYETGLFSLTFEFSNAENAFIGQFLLVSVPTEVSRGIFLPRDAVVRRSNRSYVWVVTGDGKLSRRDIKPGEVVGDEVRVESGISSGERYLVRPTGRERDGANFAGSR